MIRIGDMPEDEDTRNAPLVEVRAEYRPLTRSYGWQRVTSAYHIAQRTYNQLGPVWTEGHEWRIGAAP